MITKYFRRVSDFVFIGLLVSVLLCGIGLLIVASGAAWEEYMNSLRRP